MNDLVDFNHLLVVTLVVLAFDNVAFWKLGNWMRQFRAKSPPFTYLGSIYPRIVFTLFGSFCLASASEADEFAIPIFVLGITLIVSSYVYLYYRALNKRS